MDSRAFSLHQRHRRRLRNVQALRAAVRTCGFGFTVHLSISIRGTRTPSQAPESYGRELAQRTGSYYTQGIEEDTSALRQGVLGLLNISRRAKSFRGAHSTSPRLPRPASWRFSFFYFSEVDQNSQCPRGRHNDQLEDLSNDHIGGYRHGARLCEGATVIASGLTTVLRRSIAESLNTWLLREGFLTMSNNHRRRSRTDWKRTKAYAMGLNALYINLAGREQNGIVAPGAARDAVVADLTRRLRELRDPDTGALAISDVTELGKTSSRYAPDLIVGYAPGYRARGRQRWVASLRT